MRQLGIENTVCAPAGEEWREKGRAPSLTLALERLVDVARTLQALLQGKELGVESLGVSDSVAWPGQLAELDGGGDVENVLQGGARVSARTFG